MYLTSAKSTYRVHLLADARPANCSLQLSKIEVQLQFSNVEGALQLLKVGQLGKVELSTLKLSKRWQKLNKSWSYAKRIVRENPKLQRLYLA